jgi:F420-non-reducing hydrogenase iron-sulfur subunit
MIKMTQTEATTVNETFEPTIIVFACNWCTYTGADLAGVSRLKYPSNIRILRVMCTGRVDPAFVMKAFLNGAESVMVAGCHPGECHYLEGNLRAKERIDKMVEAIKILEFDIDRFRLEWISASEGKKFAQTMTEFTEQIRNLGPLKGK